MLLLGYYTTPIFHTDLRIEALFLLFKHDEMVKCSKTNQVKIMKRLIFKNVLYSNLALAALSMTSVQGVQADDFSNCPYNFYKGQAPVITKSALAKDNYSFCYNGFAVQYSGVARTGLWSAQYITPQRIKAGKSVKREDNFHEETRIKIAHRATLNDYRKSGFDRGHLSPSADQGTRKQQHDSFNLSNITPQSPTNNQKTWSNIEQATRATISKNHKAAYIITGTMFLGQKVKKVGNVLVPSHIFKVVYFPDLNVMGAYVTVNDESGRVDVVSVAQLEQYAGIRFFPAMNGSLTSKRFNLPLTPNQASKTHRINALNQSSSNIFEQMPNNAAAGKYQGQSNQKQTKQDYLNDVEGKIVEYGIRMLDKAIR